MRPRETVSWSRRARSFAELGLDQQPATHLRGTGKTPRPSTPRYRVLRDGKPIRKANGMPFMLPFSPDTVRWRRSAIIELRKLGINV